MSALRTILLTLCIVTGGMGLSTSAVAQDEPTPDIDCAVIIQGTEVGPVPTPVPRPRPNRDFSQDPGCVAGDADTDCALFDATSGTVDEETDPTCGADLPDPFCLLDAADPACVLGDEPLTCVVSDNVGPVDADADPTCELETLTECALFDATDGTVDAQTDPTCDGPPDVTCLVEDAKCLFEQGVLNCVLFDTSGGIVTPQGDLTCEGELPSADCFLEPAPSKPLHALRVTCIVEERIGPVTAVIGCVLEDLAGKLTPNVNCVLEDLGLAPVCALGPFPEDGLPVPNPFCLYGLDPEATAGLPDGTCIYDQLGAAVPNPFCIYGANGFEDPTGLYLDGSCVIGDLNEDPLTTDVACLAEDNDALAILTDVTCLIDQITLAIEAPGLIPDPFCVHGALPEDVQAAVPNGSCLVAGLNAGEPDIGCIDPLLAAAGCLLDVTLIVEGTVVNPFCIYAGLDDETRALLPDGSCLIAELNSGKTAPDAFCLLGLVDDALVGTPLEGTELPSGSCIIAAVNNGETVDPTCVSGLLPSLTCLLEQVVLGPDGQPNPFCLYAEIDPEVAALLPDGTCLLDSAYSGATVPQVFCLYGQLDPETAALLPDGTCFIDSLNDNEPGSDPGCLHPLIENALCLVGATQILQGTLVDPFCVYSAFDDDVRALLPDGSCVVDEFNADDEVPDLFCLLGLADDALFGTPLEGTPLPSGSCIIAAINDPDATPDPTCVSDLLPSLACVLDGITLGQPNPFCLYDGLDPDTAALLLDGTCVLESAYSGVTVPEVFCLYAELDPEIVALLPDGTCFIDSLNDNEPGSDPGCIDPTVGAALCVLEALRITQGELLNPFCVYDVLDDETRDPLPDGSCFVEGANGDEPDPYCTQDQLPEDARGIIVYDRSFSEAPGPEWKRSNGASPDSFTLPEVADGCTSTVYCGAGAIGPFGDEFVRLELETLPVHDTLTVSVDVVLLGTWDGSPTRFCGEPGGCLPDMFSLYTQDNDLILEAESFANQGGLSPWQSFCPISQTTLCHAEGYQEYESLGPSMGSNSIYRLTGSIPHTLRDEVVLNFAADLHGLANESWAIEHVVVSASLLGNPVPANNPA